MKLFVIIGVSVLALIVLLVAVVLLLGSRLPKEHIASRSIVLHRTPAEVYGVVRDFAAAPNWRADVQSLDVSAQPDGRIHFAEHGKQGVVNYELVEDMPGQRMTTRILNTDLGYSGSWTYLFVPEGAGTRLTITENGEVSNVMFRFMSRYVFGHTATIDAYLAALAKHLGETTKPE